MARRNSNKPQHQQLHKTPMINYTEDDVNVGGAGPRLSSSKLIQEGSRVRSHYRDGVIGEKKSKYGIKSYVSAADKNDLNSAAAVITRTECSNNVINVRVLTSTKSNMFSGTKTAVLSSAKRKFRRPSIIKNNDLQNEVPGSPSPPVKDDLKKKDDKLLTTTNRLKDFGSTGITRGSSADDNTNRVNGGVLKCKKDNYHIKDDSKKSTLFVRSNKSGGQKLSRRSGEEGTWQS